MVKEFPKSRFHSFAFILTLWLTWWSGVWNPSILPWFLKNYPTAPINELSNFDPASYTIYHNRIDYVLFFGKMPEGFFGMRFKDDPRMLQASDLKRYDPLWKPQKQDFLDPSKISIYHSQTAIVSDVYARLALALHLPRDATFILIKGIISFLAAFVLLPIFQLITKMWGVRAGVVLWGFLLFSTGFSLFTTSLYWSVYLSILPTTITAIVAQRIINGRCNLKTHILLILSLYFVTSIKFLSGLEFVSTILLTALAPLAMIVFVYTRVTLRIAVIASFSMFAGVITALIIMNIMHYYEFGESVFDLLISRADYWKTGNQIFDTRDRSPSRILVPLWIGVRYWGVPMLIPILLGFIVLMLAPLILSIPNYSPQHKGMAASAMVASLASFSWIILQYEHIV